MARPARPDHGSGRRARASSAAHLWAFVRCEDASARRAPLGERDQSRVLSALEKAEDGTGETVTSRRYSMHMPQSDALVEQVYDTVNRQQDERTRLEVARAAYLAAQHRATQLTRKMTAPATPGKGSVSDVK